MYRDGARKSIWQDEIKKMSTENDLSQWFDTVVVGGGITGVSTALRLQESGQKCIIIEAANIGFGTTGGTTAHLNDFFDTTFTQAIQDFGLENAQLYAESGKDAIHIIESNIKRYSISCDFIRKSAYLFALDEDQEKQLKDIVTGAARVGHEMTYVNEIPFPIPFREAVRIPEQGQFHPIKYVKALCDAFIELGGAIEENCVSEEYEEHDDYVVLKTSKGEIKANMSIFSALQG